MQHTEDEGASIGQSDDLVINLNDVEDAQGFEVLPRGMYTCEIENLEFTYSQNKGNPMWSWELRIVSGEYENRKLFYHTVWSGNGLPMTKRSVLRVFPELADKPINPRELAESGELLGKRVKARVAVRNYRPDPQSKPEKRNNVQELFPDDGGDGF